jgi:hypothetical protein
MYNRGVPPVAFLNLLSKVLRLMPWRLAKVSMSFSIVIRQSGFNCTSGYRVLNKSTNPQWVVAMAWCRARRVIF